MKQRIRHFIYFIILVGIDQLSKYLIRTELNEPIRLIPDVLSLQYHTNTGAVWGIMSGKIAFLRILTLIILIFLIYLYFKIPKAKKFVPVQILAVFIIAGAVGNLIDRFYLGYVVDFIYFELINFPLFNIADSYLTVSCILLFILVVFYYKDDDFSFLEKLIPRRKKDDPK
ncbi:signal peptidase II [Lachnospiraceae bacterium MD1]|jgi:signal peptidase II|uniref:Lipoprotein signal peptidase n=1 Tax=Variimorphobacter saccharofermentans TaxID=2755051 RepID=A0A839K1V4_9FIRM|nr:signal peptidase II [Variimorphobacter saccharofermentans]MBB2182969.1 signal peptidase II [Variimorphobacter saccharofermentans]